MDEIFTETLSPTPEIEAFWIRFKSLSGVQSHRYELQMFGSTPAMKDELAALALEGRKRATVSLMRDYQAADEPVPQIGGYGILLDSGLRPRAILLTTRLELKPLNRATDEDAYEEGEGDRTLQDWLRTHYAYFRRAALAEGWEFSDDVLAIFQRFRLLYRDDTLNSSGAGKFGHANNDGPGSTEHGTLKR